MRVVRTTGQNVSPSDDGKLFNKIFSDGLFDSVNITSLGAALVHIPAMYGIIMGREFTTEAMDFTVSLPESAGTGYIVVKYNLATEGVISIESHVGNYTPTKEDINGTGTIYEMVIATYQATSVAVSSISMVYSLADANGSGASAFTVSGSSWSSTAVTINGRSFKYQDINLVKILDEHPDVMIGASNTLPSEAEQDAFNQIDYATVDKAAKILRLYAVSPTETNFRILVKGVA